MKKGKIMSLLLAASMMISAMPATARTADNDVIEETVMADKLTSEGGNRDAEMLREERENLRLEALSEADETYADVSLMAEEESKLSGTVTLPEGASVGDEEPYIYLQKIDVDENGKILYTRGGSYIVDLDFGTSSTAQYSISVPKGKYIAEIDIYDISNVRYEYFYYRTDGIFTDSEEFASPIDLTSDRKVDINVPGMERSISGTITFTEPAKEDTHLYISARSQNGGERGYRSMDVKKGQESVDYTLGVEKDVYYLEVDNGEDYMYYSTSGTVTKVDGNRCYLNTNENSIDNIDFTLRLSGSSEPDATPVPAMTVPVTLTLPEPADKNMYCYVYSGYIYKRDSEDEGWFRTDYSNSIRINKGESSVSANVRVRDNDEGTILAVRNSNSGMCLEYSYYTGNGVSSLLNKAKPIDVYSDKTINIKLPDKKISGTVSRNGILEGEYMTAIVSAYNDEGERFFTSVFMTPDQDSAPYTLYVPDGIAGSGCKVEAELYYEPNKNVIVDYTPPFTGFTGVKSDAVSVSSFPAAEVNFDMPANSMRRVKCEAILSNPAPKGGLLLELRAYCPDGRYYAPHYYIPEGETTFNIDTYIPQETSDLDADIRDIDDNLNSRSIEIPSGSESLYLEYEPVQEYIEKEVSGKVSLPEGATANNGVSYEVTLNGWSDVRGTVMKGETESTFTAYLDEGETVDEASIEILSAGSAPLPVNTPMYLCDDGTLSFESASVEAADTDTLQFNIPASKRAITGNIVLPDDIDPYCTAVSIEAEAGSWYADFDVDLTGKNTPYCIALPDDISEEDAEILYSLYDDVDGLFDGTICCSDDGPTVVYNKYSSDIPRVTVPETGLKNINLELIGYKTVINITAEKESKSDDSSYSPNITIIPDNADLDPIEKSLYIRGSKDSDEISVSIPDIGAYKNMNSFKIAYSLYGQYYDLYINNDGTYTFDADKAYSYPVDKKNIDIKFTVVSNSYFTAQAFENGAFTIDSFTASVTNGDDENNYITASLEYKYNDTPFLNADAILCDYDEQGKFVGVTHETMKIEKDAGSCSVIFDTPVTEGHTYKVMLWDGIGRMRPLYDALNLTSEPEPTQTPEVTLEPTQMPDVTLEPTVTPESTVTPDVTPEATEAPDVTPEPTGTPEQPPAEATEAP